jgi:hypothetical protein
MGEVGIGNLFPPAADSICGRALEYRVYTDVRSVVWETGPWHAGAGTIKAATP